MGWIQTFSLFCAPLSTFWGTAPCAGCGVTFTQCCSSTQRWDWAPTLTDVWKRGEKSSLKLISPALSLIKQKQMQIQRQPFPSLVMHNVGVTDRWRKAPERKISQKWEKKENMSNEQVPGLPQLHDPILSWYILLLLEYSSSEISTLIPPGREREISPSSAPGINSLHTDRTQWILMHT